MFTDQQIQNIHVCVEFTRRNAPLNGEQLALVGDAMTAVQAEVDRRVKAAKDAAAAVPQAKKAKAR